MSPEKHEIRKLKKQLEGAAPEVAPLIEKKIAAIKTDLMNQNDFTALVANIPSRDAYAKALESALAT